MFCQGHTAHDHDQKKSPGNSSLYLHIKTYISRHAVIPIKPLICLAVCAIVVLISSAVYLILSLLYLKLLFYK